eukprot:jgi/Chrzof1/3253/Cz12g17140.t1
MLVEEFGLSHRFYSEEERMVVFAVIFDMLIDAKKSGRPFVGAMFWQAVKEGFPNVGGYHVYIDEPLSGQSVGLNGVMKLKNTAKESSKQPAAGMQVTNNASYVTNKTTLPRTQSDSASAPPSTSVTSAPPSQSRKILAGSGCHPVRVEPEIFRLNGVCGLIYYYCDCSSDCGGVVAMEFS